MIRADLEARAAGNKLLIARQNARIRATASPGSMTVSDPRPLAASEVMAMFRAIDAAIAAPSLGPFRRRYVSGCPACDRIQRERERLAPYHDASERCVTGRRPHCACDVCF